MKKRRGKKILIILGVILGIIAVGSLALFLFMRHEVNKAFDDMFGGQQPVSIDEPRDQYNIIEFE